MAPYFYYPHVAYSPPNNKTKEPLNLEVFLNQMFTKNNSKSILRVIDNAKQYTSKKDILWVTTFNNHFM
jgi:hypothetical protein